MEKFVGGFVKKKISEDLCKFLYFLRITNAIINKYLPPRLRES